MDSAARPAPNLRDIQSPQIRRGRTIQMAEAIVWLALQGNDTVTEEQIRFRGFSLAEIAQLGPQARELAGLKIGGVRC